MWLSDNVCPANFNSRPSARGDVSRSASPAALPFQFTPLREGRRRTRGGNAPDARFQFTPLREGRRACASPSVVSSSHFNSRPSARGDNAEKSGIVMPQDFNSRPSARGDGGGPQLPGLTRRISIHAPPRGATFVAFRQRLPCKFQFTPLREGRRQKICNFCKSFVQPLQISMA